MYMKKQGNPWATWRLLSNVVAFKINILQINITLSLHTTQNSPHIPGANACGRHVNQWNTMYHCMLYDAICPQLTTLITKTVLQRVCSLQKVTSTQPARNSEFRPQNVYTSTTACLEKCSFVCIMKA